MAARQTGRKTPSSGGNLVAQREPGFAIVECDLAHRAGGAAYLPAFTHKKSELSVGPP
jgi:hypothetical protein